MKPRNLLNFIIPLVFISFNLHSQDYFSKFISLSHIKSSENAEQYNFNPVLSLEERAQIEKMMKGKFKEKGTLFLVYTSEQEEETVILELKDSKNIVSVTNQNVIFADGYENKVEPYDGSILSYTFSRDNYGRKNNGAFLNKSFLSNENKLLEFIYIPDVINSLDREKTQTYLSLKYGISLYNSYYISSVNDTIWSPKENKGFESRVTGIGRDDNYGLYQRKSINSISKDIIIGVDSISIIDNNNFLLWSDNDKSTFLKNTSSSQKVGVIDRKWKVNLFGAKDNFYNLNITVFLELLFEKYDNSLQEKESVLWLVKSNTSDFVSDIQYIRQSRAEDENIVFENLNFIDGDYFSFLVAPEFFVNYKHDTILCNTHANIPIEIIGGVSPYFVEITGENYKTIEHTEDSRYQISALPSGLYTITVKDYLNNTFVFDLDIARDEQVDVFINETWVLLDNDISVIPEIEGLEYVSNYEWIKNDEIISNAPVLNTDEIGEYTLKVYTTSGCEKKVDFKIINSSLTSDHITIYPNSSGAGEPFSVDFNLSKQQVAEMFIYDISGKEVFAEKFRNIQDFKYSTSLPTSGIYLIIINTEEASLVKKIVIK